MNRDRVDALVEAIDHACGDVEVSPDAMRWAPERDAPPLEAMCGNAHVPQHLLYPPPHLGHPKQQILLVAAQIDAQQFREAVAATFGLPLSMLSEMSP